MQTTFARSVLDSSYLPSHSLARFLRGGGYAQTVNDGASSLPISVLTLLPIEQFPQADPQHCIFEVDIVPITNSSENCPNTPPNCCCVKILLSPPDHGIGNGKFCKFILEDHDNAIEEICSVCGLPDGWVYSKDGNKYHFDYTGPASGTFGLGNPPVEFKVCGRFKENVPTSFMGQAYLCTFDPVTGNAIGSTFPNTYCGGEVGSFTPPANCVTKGVGHGNYTPTFKSSYLSPNPAYDVATVALLSYENSMLNVEVVSIDGKNVVYTLSQAVNQEKSYNLAINTKQMKQGSYLVRITVGDYQTVQKLSIVK